jgi:methylglutaconyl-CoA hydratase
MHNSGVLLVSEIDGIATITLNRPQKRNAMDGLLIRELTDILAELAQHPKTRVLILTANGEHFCAGADISWMKKAASGANKDNLQDAEELAQLMYALRQFPKPTIALVHGATYGGGLGLIAASDIAIAASDSVFAFSEVKVGITPSVISPYIISAIGERATRYYFLTGKRFDADEAYRLGLIHEVVSPHVLMSTGLEVAKQLLNNSPSALTEVKRLIQEVAYKEISQPIIQFTAEHLAKMRMTPDAWEGLQAFLEKRKPDWS